MIKILLIFLLVSACSIKTRSNDLAQRRQNYYTGCIQGAAWQHRSPIDFDRIVGSKNDYKSENYRGIFPKENFGIPRTYNQIGMWFCKCLACRGFEDGTHCDEDCKTAAIIYGIDDNIPKYWDEKYLLRLREIRNKFNKMYSTVEDDF